MKFVFIADLHLSDTLNTPQEEAFDWAIEKIEKISPDACVVLGDVTACGSLDAALRFCQKINKLSCPALTVPGNSDLRNKDSAKILDKLLLSHPEGLRCGKVHIVGINTAQDKISEEERARLSAIDVGDNIILCSHQPKEYLDQESLKFLENWINELAQKGKKTLFWANGHSHIYIKKDFHGTPTVTLRALDLDKCVGGSAQILIYEFDEEKSNFESVDYSRGLHTAWTQAERDEFIDFLGITCYNNTKTERDLPFAIENGVRHLEMREIADSDIPLIQKWRQSGGKTLSLHFPALSFDGGVVGLEKFKSFAKAAVVAEVDMVTVHPPQIANETILNDDKMFDTLVGAMAEALSPVAKANIDILVENNHTDRGTPNNTMKCAYGCTPFDIIAWRDALCLRLGKNTCNLRFDVGHARNNMPLSQDYPIGKWYALIGGDAHAYHIHQTTVDSKDRHMKNHFPITGIHDGLVSFDGFLWAWHAKVLNHAPIILEIREGEGAPATYQRLKNIINSKVE